MDSDHLTLLFAQYYPKSNFSAKKLYTLTKPLNSKVTHTKVNTWIKSQSPAQVFHRRKESFYPILAYRFGSRIQIDLMDCSLYNLRVNKNIKWCFVAIDVYSRYLWIYPQKSKSVGDCIISLKKLFSDLGNMTSELVDQIDSDGEASFSSHEFKSVLDNHNSSLFLNVVADETKHSTGIVERVIGTIRTYFAKHFIQSKTQNWVSALPDFVENYNHQEHSALNKRSPADSIDKGGAEQYMLKKIQRAEAKAYNKAEFQIGDRVRLRVRHKLFDKRSDIGNFTKTIHKILKVEGLRVDGAVYTVTDRVSKYSKAEMIKIEGIRDEGIRDEGIRDEEPEEVVEEIQNVEEEERKEQQIEKRVTRRMAKEGVEKNTKSMTDEEKTERAIRGRKPVNRPFMLSFD